MNSTPSTSTASTASGGESPIAILTEQADVQASGCLYVSGKSVTWGFSFWGGKVIYATHDIDPGEKLERHLYRLSRANSQLTSEIRSQVRLSVGAATSINHQVEAETQAIAWLVKQGNLSTIEAGKLMTNLTREALESFLLVREVTYQFINQQEKSRVIVCLDLDELIDSCQKKLDNWQSLSPQIRSPYQRPYVAIKSQLESRLSPQQHQKLTKILKGLSFRQLAVVLNQDEFLLAKSLHPLILDGTLVVCPPQSPFDRFPKTRLSKTSVITDLLTGDRPTNSPQYYAKAKIICVDDSPSMLQVVGRILGNHDFEIFAISDPVKALREIINMKPDLIFLDVEMPNLDGYKLCRLLRNHSQFPKTPIVMVTGNTGFLGRAKAKIAGATDYLTKPFSRAELESMVFKHINIS